MPWYTVYAERKCTENERQVRLVGKWRQVAPGAALVELDVTNCDKVMIYNPRTQCHIEEDGFLFSFYVSFPHHCCLCLAH